MKLLTLATIVALLAITSNASVQRKAENLVKKRDIKDMLDPQATDVTPAITLVEEMLALNQPDVLESCIPSSST